MVFGIRKKFQEQGAGHFLGVIRVALALFLIITGIEFGAAVANGTFKSTDSPASFPSSSPFLSMSVGLSPVGPVAPKSPLERILSAVDRLLLKANVPYVYGGKSLGDSKSCAQCTACIQKNQLPGDSSAARLHFCPACSQCGIDCSSFVNHVFRNAGLSYDFADTNTLIRSRDHFLEAQYGFETVGSDLTIAQTGDLALEVGHVVMIMNVDLLNDTVDYIHASRGSKRTPEGGIELVRGANLAKVQRGVVRILRHRALDTSDKSIHLAESQDSFWLDLHEYLFASR